MVPVLGPNKFLDLYKAHYDDVGVSFYKEIEQQREALDLRHMVRQKRLLLL